MASAHRLRRAGERLAFRGLPPGAEPSIEWGVGRGDLTRDGAIVLVAVAELLDRLLVDVPDSPAFL